MTNSKQNPKLWSNKQWSNQSISATVPENIAKVKNTEIAITYNENSQITQHPKWTDFTILRNLNLVCIVCKTGSENKQ